MKYFSIIVFVTILFTALYFSKSLDKKDSSEAKEKNGKKKIEDEIFQSLKDEIKDPSTTEAKEKIERAVRDQGYLEKDWQIDSAVKRIKNKLNLKNKIIKEIKKNEEIDLENISEEDLKRIIKRKVEEKDLTDDPEKIDYIAKDILKKIISQEKGKMNVMDYYVAALQKYGEVNGRATRKEFWSFYVCNFFIGMVLYNTSAIAFLICGLATTLPQIAVAFRRLHDTGHSGWFLLLAFIPIVNFIGIIILLVFYLQDSETDENQYGPVPKKQ